MWNVALRRVVRDEEEREREKRVAMQLRLKREAAAAAAAATASTASSLSAAVDPSVAAAASEQLQQQASSEAASGTDSALSAHAYDSSTVSETTNAECEPAHIDDDDDDDDDHIQRHLLSLPTSKWTCLEDSQQACCLAMNPQKTVFAVGERDGRVSIWDNVSIRVITRELDPTLVAIPEATDVAESTAEALNSTRGAAKAAPDTVATGSGDNTPEDGDDDSVTNDDDASVEADDADDMDDLDDDAAVSVEDGDGNTDDNDDDGDDDDDDDDGDDGDDAAPNVSTAPAAASISTTDGIPVRTATANGLSRDELQIVKTSLKVVTSVAWSCDTRWLFAGCEEKSSRRGRLCVWDVQAATITATFSFDAAINCVSAHPGDPHLVLVSSYNTLPVLLNVATRESRTLANVPLTNPLVNTTVPANSRLPSLVAVAKFGTTGRWIYCVTSKSTAAILDSTTLACLDSTTLSVVIQFIDIAIDYRETSLIFTSAKGVHEFAIVAPTAGSDSVDRPSGAAFSSNRLLREVRAYATGAVRAPWALCLFSDDETFVVGLPVVRHRHVGESGLYTWNRATGKVQHNAGVKDGVNAVAWDPQRESVLAVSTTGALFVLEEAFCTTWSGPMYPAGYRLITDNELHARAMDDPDSGVGGSETKIEADSANTDIDVFTISEPQIGPPSAQRAPFAHLATRLEPRVANALKSIPAVPIAHHQQQHKRQQHHHVYGQSSQLLYNDEKHFGLGQSVFEPLKVPVKARATRSKRKVTGDVTQATATGDGDSAATKTTTTAARKKKRTNSAISSQKRRRR